MLSAVQMWELCRWKNNVLDFLEIIFVFLICCFSSDFLTFKFSRPYEYL